MIDQFQPYNLELYGKKISNRSRIAKERKQFILNNYKLLGVKKCAEKLGLTCSSVYVYAHKLGAILSRCEKSELMSGFISTTFTNIQTAEVAYLLGFIYADGCIDKESSGKVRITMTIVATDFLEIYSTIKKTGNWNVSNINIKNRKPAMKMNINNRNLWQFLSDNDYEIKSGASADKILSKIPDHLKHYWWRGYFDGDGWFNYKKNYKYSFGFSACYEQNWGFVKNLLEKLNIKYSYNKRIKKSGKDSSINVYSIDGVIKFGNYIYKNYHEDKIGLTRKYIKWSEIKQISDSKLEKG